MIDLSFGTKQFHEKDQKILRHWLDKIESPCPKILEIGCWTGQSTAVICAYLRSLPHWNGRVHVIDPFEGTSDSKLPQLAKEYDIRAIFEHNMKMLGFEKFIEVHQGLSQDKFFLFPNNSFDFIFVDGDHKYSGVIKDLELYWPKLRPGGIMIGHDYDSNAWDERFIENEFAENKHHGVIKAVNEFFDVDSIEHHSHFFVAKKANV
jgi:predicted O-methyltransferase YrrM